jgi:YesN/AraC family two-component response regulator
MKYGLLITDVNMPEMSGFELIRKIKKLNIDIKVLLISAFEVQPDFNFELKETELKNFLKKPIHVQQLIETVSRC